MYLHLGADSANGAVLQAAAGGLGSCAGLKRRQREESFGLGDEAEHTLRRSLKRAARPQQLAEELQSLLHVQEPPDVGAFGSPMDFRDMDEECEEERGTACVEEHPSPAQPASSWALSLWTAGRDGSTASPRGKGQGEDASRKQAPETVTPPATTPSLLALQRFPPLRQLLPTPEERNNLALIVYTGPPDLEECHTAPTGGGRLRGRVVTRAAAVQPMAVEEEARADDDDAMSLD